MAAFYVSSVAYAAIAQFAASTVYVVGNIVRQLATPAVGSERCFRVSVAGTSAASEPTWVISASGTTVSGTATFVECTGQSAHQLAADWVAAAPHLDIANARASPASSLGDQIYVASNHVETWTSVRSWGALNSVFCVTVAGSTLPPGSSSLATGASVATTGNSNFNIFRNTYIEGIAFSCSDAANNGGFTYNQAAGGGAITFKNCALKLNTTNSTTGMSIGGTGSSFQLTFINTTVEFGHAAQGLSFSTTSYSTFQWLDTAAQAILGTMPTNLIRDNTTGTGTVLLSGVNFTNFTGNLIQTNGGGNRYWGFAQAVGCKLGTSTTFAASPRISNRNAARLEMDWTDTVAGASYQRTLKALENGTLFSDNVVRRTGGAQQNNIGFSWRIAATNTSDNAPFKLLHPITPHISIWNTVVGSPITLTVHALADKAALPNQNMLWTEVEFLAETGAPILSRVESNPTSIFPASPAANTAASAAVWTAGLTARTNSQVVVRGAIRSVSSNADRAFFCTVAGTTSGSLPAGYASAVDGGAVVDGSATFRAAFRLSMSQTVTPEKVGYVSLRVHYVDAQTAAVLTDVYVDPTLAVT